MSRMIFVNLPVLDLTASISFYQALGFSQNMQFSDTTAACMVWSDSIFVMLLTHAKWQTFTSRPIPAQGSSEVMLALNADSIDAVNQFVATAGAQGGKVDVNPPQDHGFMFSRSVLDLDGHLWEVFWMDPAALTGDSQ